MFITKDPIEVVYYPHLNMHMAIFYMFHGTTFARTVEPKRERVYTFDEVVRNEGYMTVKFNVWIRILPHDFPHVKRINILTKQYKKIKANIDKILAKHKENNRQLVLIK